MPQESLRSVVYRSFLTCEDPRGVIEGKTIKISKPNPTKTENKTQSKNSKEKEKMSLFEVKNGAQKRNDDSWSNGLNFRSQPKDVAKDLLKGDLDLQESLMMLGKLQETSYITNLKNKQEKASEIFSSRAGSGRFESFQIYETGHQKDRILANGSSRDCYTELRDVIRQGLSKQNLLPNKSYYQESTEGLAGKIKLQLSPDEGSTSSSRSSSMMYSTHEFTSSESFSSRASEEKSKGSNLIAKLMGLDEFPSKPVPCIPRKPVYDVDLPNAKQPQFFGHKMDREHVSLDEIIEMMQTKGILRNNKREIKQNNKSFRDDTPPIVLMKSRRLSPDNQKIKENENSIRELHRERAKSEEILVKNRRKVKPRKTQEIEKKIDKIRKITPKSTNLISKNDSLKQIKHQKSVVTKRTSSSGLSTNKSSNKKKNMKIEKPKIIHEVLQMNLTTVREIDTEKQQSLYEAFEKDSNRVINAVTCTNYSETVKNHEENVISNDNEQKARMLKSISNFQDSKPTDFELFQDCVNEFLEQVNRIRSPLRSILSSNVLIFEDYTMREIAKDIKNLRNFGKFSQECSNADTVSRILERDIYLSTSGTAWSTGWKDGCTSNEVEEVVLVLEKMILSKLIDDLLWNL